MPQKKRTKKTSKGLTIGSKRLHHPNGLSDVTKVLMGKGMLVNFGARDPK